ncbi:tRNA splicing endonuclease SEN2 [Plasmopara halstedii]|uniref:tRNA-intron lyase n=1 Tax=Plasmopara halstedii TaxID=4781 RepID=A0A0P1ANB7_PLAHL|nr:tRNA splicing endonuclease SEN2 [Plasmopara halstedii]CEG42476.1 tRNA splicing endonuclease SEN2 [Plasmopara halstedii]|eukprot:XP_024578845.1 tRNA splicing endonuclease SEN2 [Plasmopara halstedii]
MVTWQMLPSGLETEVTFEVEDSDVWTIFQKNSIGIKWQSELSIQHESKVLKSCERSKRRRHLSLPETYYAINNCILPYDHSLEELWKKFESSSATFARNLAVYHHFRHLGWILKSGLNYGAHYVLYQGSAATYHSQYIVYVHDEDKAISWNTIQSLTRIAADVKKTVLLCTATILSKESNSIALDTNPTFGVYSFHDVQYIVEAVAIRFWDASLADESQSFNFQQLSLSPKRMKSARKKQ